MKKFFIHISMFILPFLVYFLCVAVIDPYSFLSSSPIVDHKQKDLIAYKVDNVLYNFTYAQKHRPKKLSSVSDLSFLLRLLLVDFIVPFKI